MLILASKSPRRTELLGLTGYEFMSVSPRGDEFAYRGGEISRYVMTLAETKAKSVVEDFPGSVIIGADTVATLDGKVLGKPTDPADAEEMLHLLSGRSHEVYTGVSLVCDNRMLSNFCLTTVSFRALSDSEIRDYVSSGEPMDKAGAYGIQGSGANFLSRIDGDYFNVVGLPVKLLVSMLDSFLTSFSE